MPWYECWIQQLKTEKKSEHTIRSYIVAAKTFTTTPLPNDEILSWNEVKEIQVSELFNRSDPNNGRVDSWLNTIGDLRPAAIKALKKLNIKKVSIFTPYSKTLNDDVLDYFKSEGFEVTSNSYFDIQDDYDIAKVDQDYLYDVLSKIDLNGADALFVSKRNINIYIL